MTPALTPAQKAALNHETWMCVEAGAGSGKTTVLVERYLKILSENPDIDIDQVVAITFTEKAAAEMKERLLTAVNDSQLSITGRHYRFPERLRKTMHIHHHQMAISTIHGFCASILRHFPIEAACDPNFTVLDGSQSHFLMTKAIETTLLELQRDNASCLYSYLTHLSMQHLKSDLMTLFSKRDQLPAAIDQHKREKDHIRHIDSVDDRNITQHSAELSGHLIHIFTTCLRHYNISKESHSARDFNDLIEDTVSLFRRHPQCRDMYRHHIRYLMVDEFQDTDPQQWELIIQLMGTTEQPFGNVFIVGDSKQSIYSFRGAKPELFHEIQHTFAEAHTAKVITLSDNFRTEPFVLDAINTLFTQLFEKDAKTPITYHPLMAHKENNHPSVEFILPPHDSNDSHAQYHLIAEQILKLKQTRSLEWHDIAILFRQKRQMGTLSRILDAVGIPNQVLSGLTPYRSDAIILLFNWLKSLLSPLNNLAFKAVITSPLFNIPEAVIYLCYRYIPDPPSLLEKIDIISRSRQNPAWEGISKDIQKTLADIVKQWKHWQTMASLQPLYMTLEQCLNDVEAWAFFSAQHDAETHLSHIHFFIQKIKDMEKRLFFNSVDIIDRIEHAIIDGEYESIDHNPSANEAVHILSIHASKGLEYPAIFIADCQKKFNTGSRDRLLLSREFGIGLSIPGSKENGENMLRKNILNQMTEHTLNEEKRLFYVACTRAKSHLYICANQPRKEPQSPLSYLDLLWPHLTLENDTVTLALNSTTYPLHHHSQRTATVSEKTDHTLTPIIPSKKAPYTAPKRHSAPYIRLSTSDIEQYLSCPKQYYRQSLIRTLTDHPAIPAKSQKSPNDPITPQEFGDILHNAFERCVIDDDIKPSVIISETLQRYSPKLSQHPEIQPNMETQLSTFIKHPLYMRIRNADDFETERPFTLRLNRILFEGRIDVVMRHGDEWQIIDYKTNRIAPEALNSIQTHYHRQMSLYFLALRESKSLKQSTYIAHLYFSNLGETRCITIHDSELDDLKQIVDGLNERIESREFHRPSHDVCRSCVLFTHYPNCPDERLR